MLRVSWIYRCFYFAPISLPSSESWHYIACLAQILIYLYIYILYTFIPSTLPPHRRIHNISKTSYYKTWGGHEWTQDPWSCKDEYKTGHKISPRQIQYVLNYHDKFSIKSRALNQPSSDIIKFHKNVVYCHHHYQHHHHHHHKWRLISEKVKRVGKTKFIQA